MKPWTALALGLALAATGSVAPAAAPPAPQVEVGHAWIRVLPGTLPAGGYAEIRNNGDAPRALVGASSPAYRHVMLHRSVRQDGMSHMRRVDKLPLPAHATVKLAPGGYHLMLMQATHAVEPGDKVPITLRFADGATLQVTFTARPANATGDGPH